MTSNNKYSITNILFYEDWLFV